VIIPVNLESASLASHRYRKEKVRILSVARRIGDFVAVCQASLKLIGAKTLDIRTPKRYTSLRGCPEKESSEKSNRKTSSGA
jgi:hypothetical protein